MNHEDNTPSNGGPMGSEEPFQFDGNFDGNGPLETQDHVPGNHMNQYQEHHQHLEFFNNGMPPIPQNRQPAAQAYPQQQFFNVHQPYPLPNNQRNNMENFHQPNNFAPPHFFPQNHELQFNQPWNNYPPQNRVCTNQCIENHQRVVELDEIAAKLNKDLMASKSTVQRLEQKDIEKSQTISNLCKELDALKKKHQKIKETANRLTDENTNIKEELKQVINSYQKDSARWNSFYQQYQEEVYLLKLKYGDLSLADQPLIPNFFNLPRLEGKLKRGSFESPEEAIQYLKWRFPAPKTWEGRINDEAILFNPKRLLPRERTGDQCDSYDLTFPQQVQAITHASFMHRKQKAPGASAWSKLPAAERAHFQKVVEDLTNMQKEMVADGIVFFPIVIKQEPIEEF